MSVLETLQAWLCTCPHFPLGLSWSYDHVGAAPGSIGLYPLGMEEKQYRRDILGNVRAVYQQQFQLQVVTCPDPKGGNAAAALLAFQHWVAQQCAQGNTPVFGDVPEEEKILAEKGKLASVSKAGSCKYTVRLTVRFVKNFERS